jgi:hypothetical protein
MMRAFRAVSAFSVLFLLSGVAYALPITQQLVVNPIQVCDDFGDNCANPDQLLYEAEADQIWLQAGIDIEFLPWKQWNNSSVLTISSSYDLVLPGNQALGGDIAGWRLATASSPTRTPAIRERGGAIRPPTNWATSWAFRTTVRRIP